MVSSENRDQRSAVSESAKKRESEKARKITCVTKVSPLTEKRKISWRPLKIEYQLFPPIPCPLPPAPRGGKGNFFCGALQAGVARLQSPHFFSPPPQRRRRRWGGGRGWGKSYRPQRFLHRRLAPWRQAEQSPHIFIFGRCAPAHGVSFENRDQRVSEKANQRIGESLTFTRGHVRIFTRGHVRTFQPALGCRF